MDKLPIELLELILHAAEFSIEECIANRLVCRSFCTVLTPKAFSVVRTNRLSKESFDRLCAIAQTPELAKHVVEYQYNLEQILHPTPYCRVDDLLYAMSTTPGDEDHGLVDVVQAMQDLHESHQRYLKQQDILGTFYDTLSIFKSLPLFYNLRKIRICESEESRESGLEYASAFFRAFWSIVKSMAAIPLSACTYFCEIEFDRFHYQALCPLVYHIHSSSPATHREAQQSIRQAKLFMNRATIFKINDICGAWLQVDGTLVCTLKDMLSDEDSPLTELRVKEDLKPKPAERWKETFFLWSHDAPELTMAELVGVGSKFANLRRLELKANKLLNMMVFVAMLIRIPEGVLEELSLHSLGFQGQTSWLNFFRVVAPKKLWTEENEHWRGSGKHWAIQTSILEAWQGSLDPLMVKNAPEELPENIKELVWKGLNLKYCTLTGLVNHSIWKGATVVPNEELRQYEKWMTEGLEEEEYDKHTHSRDLELTFRERELD